MSYTQMVHFTNVITGVLKVDRRWINKLNSAIEVEGGSSAGSITATVLTTVTAQTITSGQIPDQGINNVQVVFTGVDKSVTYRVDEKNKNNFFNKSPAVLAQIAKKAGDSLAQAAETSTIANLVAATPTLTETLPSGHANFELGSTTPADFAALLQQTLGRVVAKVSTQTGSTPLGDLIMLAAPTAYGNLLSLTDSVLGLKMVGDTPTYKGTPIYAAISTSASWGAANEECVFCFHPEAVGLKMEDAFLQGGGLVLGTDLIYRYNWVAPYWHGIVFEDGIAAVINGAS